MLNVRAAARRTAVCALLLGFGSAAMADVWINELHYDNSGTDANERVEIIGTAGAPHRIGATLATRPFHFVIRPPCSKSARAAVPESAVRIWLRRFIFLLRSLDTQFGTDRIHGVRLTNQIVI